MLSPSQHLSLTWVHTNIPRVNLGSALPSPLASGFHQTVSSQTARINHTWSIVNLTTPNPGRGQSPRCAHLCRFLRHRYRLKYLHPHGLPALSPRFGFAFQLNAKSVVRGGYGVYYSDYLPNTDIVNSGFASQGNFTNTTGSVSPVFTLASAFPPSPPPRP